MHSKHAALARYLRPREQLRSSSAGVSRRIDPVEHSRPGPQNHAMLRAANSDLQTERVVAESTPHLCIAHFAPGFASRDTHWRRCDCIELLYVIGLNSMETRTTMP